MNATTRAYERYGLPATLPAEKRAAWEDWQAGRGALLRLLPLSGDTCHAESMGGPYCGRPLLIDGTCPGRNDHRDVVEAELGEIEEDDDGEA